METTNIKNIESFFDNCVIFVEQDNENYTLEDFYKGITELHQFLLSISSETESSLNINYDTNT
jgi:hypothetical protein